MTPLEELNKEKELLKSKIVEHEQRIIQHFAAIENNFGKIALNSFLPGITSKINKTSSFIPSLSTMTSKLFPSSMSDEKKQKYESIVKTVEIAASALAVKYLKKFLFK